MKTENEMVYRKNDDGSLEKVAYSALKNRESFKYPHELGTGRSYLFVRFDYQYHKKKCPTCKRTFVYLSWAKYCSPECRTEAYRARRRRTK